MQHPGPYQSGADWHGPWMGRSHTGPSRRARLLLPVFFSLLVQLPSVFLTVSDRRPVPLNLPPAEFWLALSLAVIGPLALLFSRRFPGPVVVIATAAACVGLFSGRADDGPVYISLGFAIVSAVVRGKRLWAWISVGAGWIISITIGLFAGFAWAGPRIALTTFGLLVVFGLAEATRTRREAFAQVSRIRAQRQQSEVQAERVRIARELHDVLAHSLSQINVQAGVGLHLMENQPEKAREALANIKETSKSALDEVRSVLGVLRSESGGEAAPLVPESDLSRIDWLAAMVSRQGIEATVVGSIANVPRAVQLAMFRIVQESLTNVVRHAKATRATIELAEQAGFYTATISDNGTAPPPPEETEGRGLLGMRERAALLGGTLETGPAEGGGFRVRVLIPVRTKVTTE